MKKNILALLIIVHVFLFSTAEARSIYSPWESQPGFESLVYGSSSPWDVQRVMGQPDDIISGEQMYPVIDNYYYHDEAGTDAATVFVFENGLLAGLFYKSASQQFVDLSYLLTNNGDRMVNWPINAGFRSYAPYFPLYGF